MVASCSIGRPGHTLIHAVPSLTLKFSLIMRAIIDFQNLSPALKDAMLTYVARLRTGRLITGLAAITLIAVGFFPLPRGLCARNYAGDDDDGRSGDTDNH
jgi:hypothetical protein